MRNYWQVHTFKVVLHISHKKRFHVYLSFNVHKLPSCVSLSFSTLLINDTEDTGTSSLKLCCCISLPMLQKGLKNKQNSTFVGLIEETLMSHMKTTPA